jgi:hypothetical protein
VKVKGKKECFLDEKGFCKERVVLIWTGGIRTNHQKV